MPAAIVYLTKLVVDGVVVRDVRHVLLRLLLLGGVLLLMEVVRNAINWVRTVRAELLQDHITSLILRPPVNLPLDQLQPIDLAFELAITQLVGERVIYRLVILE